MVEKQLTDKELANKLHWAIYCMDKRLNTEYFAEFCEEHYDMTFGPSTIKDKDPVMTQVYLGICRYLADNNIQDVRKMSIEEINKAIHYPISNYQGRTVKEEYDTWIEGKAKTVLEQAHKAQKPIILVSEMDKVEARHILDLTRYHGPAEINLMMNIPVNPLGAPAPEKDEYLNMKYRMINSVTRFDSYADKRETMLFETDNAVFAYCPNPSVAKKLDDLEKEFLRDRNLPEPQIGGRAGVLKAMAEYKGIQQPEVLQEFVATKGAYREDALAAVEKIFDVYNQQGMPIYASSKDTCFKSLDGGYHNYPILMIPGDMIKVDIVNDNNFASIGDHEGIIPEEMTVLAVHSNDHGDIVITDAGVFAVGGIGKNLVDQFRIMEQSQDFKQKNIDIDEPIIPGNR